MSKQTKRIIKARKEILRKKIHQCRAKKQWDNSNKIYYNKQ